MCIYKKPGKVLLSSCSVFLTESLTLSPGRVLSLVPAIWRCANQKWKGLGFQDLLFAQPSRLPGGKEEKKKKKDFKATILAFARIFESESLERPERDSDGMQNPFPICLQAFADIVRTLKEKLCRGSEKGKLGAPGWLSR